MPLSDAALEEINKEFKANRPQFLKDLRAKAKDAYQGVFAVGYGKKEAEVKKAEEERAAAGGDEDDLQAQLDEANKQLAEAQRQLEEGAPDVVALKKSHRDAIKKLKEEHAEALKAKDGRINELENGGTLRDLEGVLDKEFGVDPLIGRALLKDNGARIKPAANGQPVQLLDEDGVPYSGKTLADQMKAMAESLADTVPAHLKRAKSGGGGGTHSEDPAPATGSYDPIKDGEARGRAAVPAVDASKAALR
jgi:hypothetical protein